MMSSPTHRLRAARRLMAVASGLASALGAVAGCGGASAPGVAVPHVAPARRFALAEFRPGGRVTPGRPIELSFVVREPDGRLLTRYRAGPGPHTGVHLIIVRDDLAYILHRHPPIGAGGLLRQRVVFPAPGPYRVLVDVYPSLRSGPVNFQLAQTITVSGAYRPRPLPPFKPDVVVAGYRVEMQTHVRLRAIQAQFLQVTVRGPRGRQVRFVPWFGALAHAIFFREGSLDYFHSHVCARGATSCGALLGVSSSRVNGHSTAPGRLTVGVLLPAPGTWRLFLQMKPDGRLITAPFTLRVSS